MSIKNVINVRKRKLVYNITFLNKFQNLLKKQKKQLKKLLKLLRKLQKLPKQELA